MGSIDTCISVLNKAFTIKSISNGARGAPRPGGARGARTARIRVRTPDAPLQLHWLFLRLSQGPALNLYKNTAKDVAKM